MPQRVDNINTDILRQTREQIGLTLPYVAKKVAKIEIIEKGEQKPTFKQLDTLAELYRVPRWVFISKYLPEEYQFTKSMPVFRKFSDSGSDIFDGKVRSISARVEKFRELILELREDMGEPVPEFDFPILNMKAPSDELAGQIRKWLGISGQYPDFMEWKKILEGKNIFIFMTSKYKGWSHVDKAVFRGLSVYHQKLPVIIINDSDYRKAQSFTLFHELCHLLKKESSIDGWEDYLQQVERWCDELAAGVLMPANQFRDTVYNMNITGLDQIKNIADCFKVSAYACLIRLKQLRLIAQDDYLHFKKQLEDEYRKLQTILKKGTGGPARNRPQELLKQYGHIYAKAVFQAYNNKDIGLHKLCQAFDLKRASYLSEMGRML
jgi:Zn-dependent peptidase ImmA (M78 family)/transcriptional regulator with XRE-family HTH domain